MPTPARVLYATQAVAIFPTGSASSYYYLPVNSVSLDVTNPIENVLVFGTLGASARVQKEPSKTKISIKSYLITGAGGGNSIAFDATAIQTLTGNALAGTYSKVVVEPYGFTGYGILTSLGMEASTNNFVTLDLSFEGLGSPVTAGTPGIITNNSYNGGNNYTIPTGVTPVTSNLVGVGTLSTDPLFTGAAGGNYQPTGAYGIFSGNCATSAKFSLDIPSDTIMCLGSQITGNQLAVASGNIMVAKPPFKATLVVEGTAASECDTVDFGPLIVNLPTPRLVSTAINQAVGNVGQTYNYNVEDVNAVFQASTLIGAGQPNIVGPN
jgi:hypothetical protein